MFSFSKQACPLSLQVDLSTTAVDPYDVLGQYVGLPRIPITYRGIPRAHAIRVSYIYMYFYPQAESTFSMEIRHDIHRNDLGGWGRESGGGSGTHRWSLRHTHVYIDYSVYDCVAIFTSTDELQ